MRPAERERVEQAQHQQQQVEQRLFRYAGCGGYVQRWFITTDAVPMPYRTEAEALAELQRRIAAGERRGQA
jgi:hypothetical protein